MYVCVSLILRSQSYYNVVKTLVCCVKVFSVTASPLWCVLYTGVVPAQLT